MSRKLGIGGVTACLCAALSTAALADGQDPNTLGRNGFAAWPNGSAPQIHTSDATPVGQTADGRGVFVIDEGFTDITLLEGAGWAMTNNSEPLGITDWYQGNTDEFDAHSGDPSAYIAANWNNASGVGTISNWLITPEITLSNGMELSFFTRTTSPYSGFADRLQARMSLAGPSTDVGTSAESVGDFAELLLDINPDLLIEGYPDVWTEYVIVLEGIAAPTSGRLALRYYVTDAGPFGNNADYIGIDTVTVTSVPGSCSVAILTADPADGTEDARQPYEPVEGGEQNPEDRQGVGSASEPIVLTLDTNGVLAECFSLCETSPDPILGPNGIASVSEAPGGGEYTLVLNHAIAPGAWTTIYVGETASLAYLAHPANANHDSVSNASDVLAVIDMLNGVVEPPFGEYSTDIDHSGGFTASDILRTIDLLNGAANYAPWLGVFKPDNDCAAPVCGAPGSGDCCVSHDTPGCEIGDCCEEVCAQDAFCCEGFWDTVCVDAAEALCGLDCSLGDCCQANGTPGCDDAACAEAVCFGNPFCCDIEWDALCAEEAIILCPDLCGAPSDSCAGICHGQAPDGCYCDDECFGSNDCCPDVCVECPDLAGCTGQGSCAGACGGMSPDGCWCDDTCDAAGDCCPDVCIECPDAQGC